jgi:hypothetical protein
VQWLVWLKLDTRKVVYVPCGPTISWTGGDIGGDGTETNKSYFNNHFV